MRPSVCTWTIDGPFAKNQNTGKTQVNVPSNRPVARITTISLFDHDTGSSAVSALFRVKDKLIQCCLEPSVYWKRKEREKCYHVQQTTPIISCQLQTGLTILTA